MKRPQQNQAGCADRTYVSKVNGNETRCGTRTHKRLKKINKVVKNKTNQGI
jgi:hypothetical protein